MTTALPAPRPIDALELPPDLDGRHGTNRANGRMQVAADTDLDALRAWLARFADTKTTFDNYRKEAERLLLWSVLQIGKPLSSLSHEDLLVYQHFLADPQPAGRWLFTLLYLGGLRITEVGTNTMGRFFRRGDENGTDRWWLDVMGKGGKARLVPATAEMMTELGTYRRARGLPALPSPGEDTPLVLPVGRSLKPRTRAALHRIVKDVFSGAAQSLRARGEDHAQRADRLEQASAHWLRHSAGSHMTDRQVDLRLVRHSLGHASLTTTSQYLHVDDDRRHRETDEKHRIDW